MIHAVLLADFSEIHQEVAFAGPIHRVRRVPVEPLQVGAGADDDHIPGPLAAALDRDALVALVWW